MMPSRNINVGVHPAVSLKDCVGNIPIRSNDQPETSSSFHQPNNNCGVYTYHMQYRPNSRSERCKYIFTFICFVYLFVYNYSITLTFIVFTATRFRQLNTNRWNGLMYPYYSTYSARLESFLSSPALSNQSADNLSAGGFFYTGELLYK